MGSVRAEIVPASLGVLSAQNPLHLKHLHVQWKGSLNLGPWAGSWRGYQCARSSGENFWQVAAAGEAARWTECA